MKKPREQGVVILFAILAIGLMVGIGVALSTLTQQQLILSSIGKQSQVAFYAADTGAECARYWDLAHNAFNTRDEDGNLVSVPITCANISPSDFSVNDDGITSGFTIDIVSPSGFPSNNRYNYCASVKVTKKTTGETIIESRGYNLPCIANYSSRKVERAVRLTY